MTLVGRAAAISEVEVSVDQRDLLAWDLRRQGHSYAEISQELGVSSKNAAYLMVERAMGHNPIEHLEVVRQIELSKLDEYEVKAREILHRRHVSISASGKLVYDANGEPVEDDTVALKALDTLMKIAARRAKITGLDYERPQVNININFDREGAKAQLFEFLGRLRQ